MTPDDILEDMVNELNAQPYTIKNEREKWSISKAIRGFIQKFHPKHSLIKNLPESVEGNC